MKRRAARALAKGGPARAHKDASGRVHLALLRDPATGAEQVVLRAPVFAETWQNELTAGAANTVRGVLGGAASLEGAIALAKNVMAATSRLAEGLLARAPEGAVACKSGCDHCCYQSVGVTPPEALAIFAHLMATRSEGELARFREHLADRYRKTRGLSSAERFSPEQPCVFLEAGRCSIYEVRPLSCRAMNSLDADECSKRLREPEARAAFLESGAGSRSFMEPIRAFHAVSAGLQLGLSELYALDMRPLDLVAAMQLLVTGPDSLGAAWVAGENALEPARGGDSSGTAAVQHLSGALPELGKR
jgi:Fe-S-cluster containining protein